MLGLKVELKDAEKTKKKLLSKGSLNFLYKPKLSSTHIIFPVIKPINNLGQIVKEEFKKHQKKESWTDVLRKELSKQELEYLKTSHDVVGNIAIIEIPLELEKKQRIIAESLLKSNPNIKTVLKKAGEHKGMFRTQKMEWLAGEKTKEAIYKENNVQLKLNVEGVYFSSRLSTERKRIMQKVKKGEDILVMFSGCAPYPCVLAKNTDANTITGIELNPIAHKYGNENLVLNKIGNVRLIKGDVNRVLPNLYKQSTGLKSSIRNNEMQSRIGKSPLIFELFLEEKDIIERVKLEEAIKYLRRKGVEEIYLHMPHNYGKEESYLDNPNSLKQNLKFADIVYKNKVNAIIHVSRTELTKEKVKQIVSSVNAIKKRYLGLVESSYYFENLIKSFSEEKEIMMLAKKIEIKNLCLDVAHHYQKFQDNEKLLRFIKNMKQEFHTYFHLNDSTDEKEGLEIGRGKIDFERILPLVNKGIIEVVSKNEVTAEEMLKSYEWVTSQRVTFDRILMPLPKSAEDFLEAAFSVAKKGTIIHFYDFLHETEFEKTEEKVKAACAKVGIQYEVLEFVKCGQYSPGKFRVCLDFKIK